MPRPDAAGLVAKHLHALPHPDGTHLRFLHYSSFGQDDSIKQQINGLAKGVGEAIIHLLETNHYTLSHADDPKPADQAGMKIAIINCTACKGPIMQIAINDDLTGKIDISKIKQDCPHG